MCLRRSSFVNLLVLGVPSVEEDHRNWSNTVQDPGKEFLVFDPVLRGRRDRLDDVVQHDVCPRHDVETSHGPRAPTAEGSQE